MTRKRRNVRLAGEPFVQLTRTPWKFTDVLTPVGTPGVPVSTPNTGRSGLQPAGGATAGESGPQRRASSAMLSSVVGTGTSTTPIPMPSEPVAVSPNCVDPAGPGVVVVGRVRQT